MIDDKFPLNSLRRPVRTMKLLFFFLFSIFPLSVLGQDALPEYGKLSDLTGKSKYYIIGSSDARKVVLKALEKHKSFVTVDKAEDAEFFIEYRFISKVPVFNGYGITETGELLVYFSRDKTRVVVWSETKSGGTPSNTLAKMFLKDYEKAIRPSS